MRPSNWDLQLPGQAKAILVDLDGTLALRQGRSPYDWDSVLDDDVNDAVVAVVRAVADAGYAIVVVSGRDEVCRDSSVQWLDQYLSRPYALLMRAHGDNRRDEVVKSEMWQAVQAQGYDVRMAFDDRNRCVDLWRSLGIPTFQVAEGDF